VLVRRTIKLTKYPASCSSYITPPFSSSRLILAGADHWRNGHSVEETPFDLDATGSRISDALECRLAKVQVLGGATAALVDHGDCHGAFRALGQDAAATRLTGVGVCRSGKHFLGDCNSKVGVRAAAVARADIIGKKGRGSFVHIAHAGSDGCPHQAEAGDHGDSIRAVLVHNVAVHVLRRSFDTVAAPMDDRTNGLRDLKEHEEDEESEDEEVLLCGEHARSCDGEVEESVL